MIRATFDACPAESDINIEPVDVSSEDNVILVYEIVD
jgi:hypothetical protein